MPAIKLPHVLLDGFSAESAMAGEWMKVVTRATVTSDSPVFFRMMQGVENLIGEQARALKIPLVLDQYSNVLLVVHEDASATLYLDDFPRVLEARAKNDVAAGELVSMRDILDIRRFRFQDVALLKSDKILCCVKVGWKFGLFFDLDRSGPLDVEKMELDLAHMYRALRYYSVYEALSDNSAFQQIVDAGWFPFAEILGGEFEELLEAYGAKFNILGQREALVAKFGELRIATIQERWWRNPILSKRQPILQPALEAFKRGDSVSCLKILLTEIEGILREDYIVDTSKNAQSVPTLLSYLIEKSSRKAASAHSLLFQTHFLTYMRDSIYARFFPTSGDGTSQDASRHSVGHGAAVASAYTRERALQTILTLDQINFHQR